MSLKYHQILTLSEFIQEVDKPHNPICQRRTSRSNDDSWAGASYDNARKMFETGWPEGTKKISQMAANSEDHNSNTYFIEQSTLQPSVSGGSFDIDLFLQGEPECMLDFQSEHIEKPVLKIGVQLSLAARYTTDQYMARGAAYLSLINALQFSGYSVEIVAFNFVRAGSSKGTEAALHEIVIKKADEPLDIDSIAYTIGHAAFFRRLFFSMMESCPDTWYIKNIVHDAYGYPANMLSEYHDYDICSTYNPENFETPEKAQQWIKGLALKAGIKLS